MRRCPPSRRQIGDRRPSRRPMAQRQQHGARVRVGLRRRWNVELQLHHAPGQGRTTRSRTRRSETPRVRPIRAHPCPGGRARLRRGGWRDRLQARGDGRVARATDRPPGRRAACPGGLRGRAGRPLRFKAWAEDEAGNRSAEMKYGSPGSSDDPAVPASGGTQLHVVCRGAGMSVERGSGTGGSPEVRGQLLSADRDPLPLQTVKVHEQYALSWLESQHTGKAVADKDGRFALRLSNRTGRRGVSTSPIRIKRYGPPSAEVGLKVESGVLFNTSRRRVGARREHDHPWRGGVRTARTEFLSGGELRRASGPRGRAKIKTVEEERHCLKPRRRTILDQLPLRHLLLYRSRLLFHFQ